MRRIIPTLAKSYFISITLSPVSLAALGTISQARGLSLRFPRFVRIREDKGAEQASDGHFLAEIYRNQQGKGGGDGGADDGDLLDIDMEEDAGAFEDEGDL